MPVVLVPGVVIVAGALLALLLLWGIQSFVKALAGVIPSDLPVIGSRLHDVIEAVAAAAMAAIQWVMAEAIRPVVNFVLAPVYRLLDLLAGLEQFAATAAGSWRWLLDALPKAFGAAADFAASLVHTLGRELRALIYAARAYTLTLYHAARAYALGLYHDARRYAAGLVHAAQADLAAAIGAVDATAHALTHAARLYAAELVREVRGDLVKAVEGAEHLARAEVATVTGLVVSTAAQTIGAAEAFTITTVEAAVKGLTVDIPDAIAATWDGVISDVGALQGVIASDFPDLAGLLDAIPASVPLDVAGALTGALTLTRVATRYMTECGVPNCRNLGGVGRALSELFGFVEGAAFLAILAELIADPEGAAREAAAIFPPIIDPLANAAKDLLGVG